MNPIASPLKDRTLHILRECLSHLSGYEDIDLYHTIESSIERLMQPMQLAIIGKISSSKSTLVNAILGQPEVVRTGQMEETFNVSWLKYGPSDSNIHVVFKDGASTSVPRNDWVRWTSHQAKNSLKENVQYIEVFYEHEILKDVNIIDTPGLDALSQIDSKNTIAFLKEVKPDAVVMLFTKSIAESTLSVLQEFQNVDAGDYNLSALNAIGVLAKVDTIWSSMEPEKDVLSIGQRVIQTTLFDKYPEVRKSLFSILPVSSLIGLAASCIENDDIRAIKILANTDDAILLEMLSSPDFFSDEDYKVDIPAARRQMLCEKFGLYGIYVLIDAVRRNKDANLMFLSTVLREKSGFDRLLYTIQSHFGDRATLIKSQNVLQNILSEIQQAKFKYVSDKHRAISNVESLIVTALLSLHEYREWKYLSRYYDGKLVIPDDVANEFICLCGEKGYTAKERLQCGAASSIDELNSRATQRALYWQKQYNIFSVIEPELSDFYKVMISSYNILLKNIRSAFEAYNKAKLELEINAQFLGINK